LKLSCDEPLSSFGFNFNLRPSKEARKHTDAVIAELAEKDAALTAGRCRLTPG